MRHLLIAALTLSMIAACDRRDQQPQDESAVPDTPAATSPSTAPATQNPPADAMNPAGDNANPNNDSNGLPPAPTTSPIGDPSQTDDATVPAQDATTQPSAPTDR